MNVSSNMAVSGKETAVENDKLHVSARDGTLFIHDLQSYHEGSFYCTVSNGRESLKTGTVDVTIFGKLKQDGKIQFRRF